MQISASQPYLTLKNLTEENIDGGCDSKCWAAAKKEGSPWSRRAGLAKAFCESKR